MISLIYSPKYFTKLFSTYYDLTPKQKKSREHSRSLFVAKDMKAGDVFTPENLRSVRPSCGLHTKYYEELLGKRITRDAKLGTPMSWDLVDFSVCCYVLFSGRRQCENRCGTSDALSDGGTGIAKINRTSGAGVLSVCG